MFRTAVVSAFAIFAAMGCGGDDPKGSQVAGSALPQGQGDGWSFSPVGSPPAKTHPDPLGASVGVAGEEKSSGSSGDFSLPESGWGLAGVILGLVALIAGCVLLYKGNLRWGVPLALAGLAAFVAVLGWGGLSLSPPWEWILPFWIILSAWIFSKSTPKFKWDDRAVVLGSLGMFLLSVWWSGTTWGRNHLGHSGWWILECLWVLAIAEAIWRSEALQARPLARYGSLAAGWVVLGVLS